MKVSRVREMQQLDQAAIHTYGIPEAMLMENAGLAVYAAAEKEIGIQNKRFVVVCGLGNNGGDGFVTARKILSNHGVPKILIVGNRGKYTGTARMNLEILENLPAAMVDVASLEDCKAAFIHCDAVIDAMFGTGLTRAVEGFHADLIALINGCGKPVISVDIPSGINGDNGQIMGTAVKAAVTVTFGAPKIGNMLYPGHAHCGKLFVSNISFPPGITDALKIMINPPVSLPPRNPNFHKGDFGNLLCIAGSAGYYGAPYLSALSFLKAGGGYSRLAAPASMVPFIAQKGGELVFIPQTETSHGSIGLQNEKGLLELSTRMDMVILGPGLSLDEETRELVRRLSASMDKPLLIDGDGITAISENPGILGKRKAPTILTPHVGEMGRLTGLPVADIETHRVDVLQNTAKSLNAVVVLKGAHSLVGCPDGRVFINMTGNSGMGTAGSGDVLTGTIAAMVRRGVPIEDAVCKGVYLHGLSGDLAAKEKGEDGILAGDILEYLPMAVKTVREGLPQELKSRYQGAVQVL